MTAPQPMTIRRGGAQRGNHGSYVAAAAEPVAAEPSDTIGTETTRSDMGSGTRRMARSTPATDALAASKAAYDAKPKVIFRAVDPDIDAKLRAIYKHQLRRPGGIEGWSEWGRHMLAEVVDRYEAAHGRLEVEDAPQPLRPGRVAGN